MTGAHLKEPRVCTTGTTQAHTTGKQLLALTSRKRATRLSSTQSTFMVYFFLGKKMCTPLKFPDQTPIINWPSEVVAARLRDRDYHLLVDAYARHSGITNKELKSRYFQSKHHLEK